MPSPIAATITPPIAGPTVRVKLNIIALKAIAWRRSSRPTMSTVKDCRVGTSIAVMMPSAKAQQDDDRDVDVAREHHHGQDRRLDHAQAARDHEHFSPVRPVGDHPGKRRDEEDRRLRHERHQAQQERRLRQPIHQPAQRHGLDPAADQRDHLTGVRTADSCDGGRPWEIVTARTVRRFRREQDRSSWNANTGYPCYYRSCAVRRKETARSSPRSECTARAGRARRARWSARCRRCARGR